MIGKSIKIYEKNKKLKQDVLAKEIGISQQKPISLWKTSKG